MYITLMRCMLPECYQCYSCFTGHTPSARMFVHASALCARVSSLNIQYGR